MGTLDILEVTDDDMAGGGRLRPTRQLRVPGYMPFLGGLEAAFALYSVLPWNDLAA